MDTRARERERARTRESKSESEGENPRNLYGVVYGVGGFRVSGLGFMEEEEEEGSGFRV
jgi:hypothetical protein